jgi:hypothetical protein
MPTCGSSSATICTSSTGDLAFLQQHWPTIDKALTAGSIIRT